MKRMWFVSILVICAVSQGCAGFSVDIQNDSFGTFQPFNNQYRTNMDVKFRSGLLIQVSDFVDAGHAYDWVKLYGSGREPVQTIARGGAEWVDIECGVTDQNPMTPDQAAYLSPDPNHPNRRLHADMMPDPLIPITLWEPAKGLKIQSSRFFMPDQDKDPNGIYHGHQRFVITTRDTCVVRVWKDLMHVTNTYEKGRIRRVVIGEDNPPTQHGGVHSPPWNN